VSSTLITTGDDVAIPVTLKKNGVTFAIDAAATVKAALVSTDRSSKLSADVTCSNAAAGADWANSLVVVEFSSAVSGAVTVPDSGRCLLEIQVDDSGKLTWTAPLQIVAGLIA